jgi:type IV pilus assembly protein PilC
MNNSIDIREIRAKQTQKNEVSFVKSNTKGTSFWQLFNKDFKLFGSAIPEKIKESFYVELATLMAAGMDIRSSIDLICNGQSKKKYRATFNDILEEIIDGSSLSSALKDCGKFTSYEYFSIQIGEETGKIAQVLNELGIFFKKKINQKRQIIGAITYPALVLLVAFGAVSFMMAFVVPMFSDVLKRFGGDLPFITKFVLAISSFSKHYTPMFILLILAIIVIIILQKDKMWLRDIGSKVILKMPIAGQIVRKIYIARFANTMSLLIASHMPLLQSIQLVKKMVGFFPIEQSLNNVESDILTGISLHQSLSKHSIYPDKMVSLIKVGEEVNQLDTFFAKISEQYSAEVEYQTNILSKFIEPLIIVVLGIVVGIILIAMYLPLFKLGQTF